jgi:predicted nucleotidyltransferase
LFKYIKGFRGKLRHYRNRSLLDIVAIKKDREYLVGCEVDVVTEAAISPSLRAEVLREAVGL